MIVIEEQPMTSSACEQNLPIDLMKSSETILITNTDQPLTTTATIIADRDLTTDDKHQSTDSLSNPIHQKQKSLISVYDNHLQQQTTGTNYPLVGILGRNRRSDAFRKRLLRSGFPNPILCDIRSTIELEPSLTDSNYVSYELFYDLSPTIVLVTDDLATSFEDLFPQTKQQLVVDTRELLPRYFSKAAHLPAPSIPGSYRAFGNFSDWEIEHGTQRARVAIEQYAPSNLIKFIYDLDCFTRGIDIVDQHSYSNKPSPLFPTCLFPLISALIVFTLCWLVSMIEHSHEKHYTGTIYRQASSITAATSIILLALLYAIRPVLDIIDLSYASIFKSQNLHKKTRLDRRLFQRCLRSRSSLAWCSLSFALLHLIFLVFCQLDLHARSSTYGFFLGVFTLVLLCILSCVHLPWISERVLWVEYHFLTSYLGLLCLSLAGIHVIVLRWKGNSNSFSLKAFSLILPCVVLMLRLVLYGMVYPIRKLIQRTNRRPVQPSLMPARDASVFL